MTNTNGNIDVAILMATYNGEKYIREQIHSIQQQSHTNWRLYVQDDLSTDNTLSIVRELAANDKRICILPNNQKYGAMQNFAHLMESVEAKYYFFADQDDVWLPDKISKTLQVMLAKEKENADIPIIVHTDLKVVDVHLNEISPSLWHMLRISPNLLRTFDSLAAHCLLTGCAMAFNRKLRDISIPFPDEAIMHDTWLGLMTYKNGGIICEINQPTMLYRQHESNTLGAKDNQHKYLSGKLKNISKTYKEQKDYFRMLKKAGHGSIFKFYREKWRYYRAYGREQKLK